MNADVASTADLLRFTMTSALESRFSFLLEGSADGTAATPESLLDRLLAGAAADVAQTRMLVQVWAEITKDHDLMVVASENISRLRGQITASLQPWAEDRAQEDSGELAAHTTETLITASFGFAIRLALDPATDPATLRRSLLAIASAGARAAETLILRPSAQRRLHSSARPASTGDGDPDRDTGADRARYVTQPSPPAPARRTWHRSPRSRGPGSRPRPPRS